MQATTKTRTYYGLKLLAPPRHINRATGQMRTRPIRYQRHLLSVQFPAQRVLDRPIEAPPAAQMPSQTPEFAALRSHE